MSAITTHFNTTGMHCPSCSMLIEMTLNKEPGVESAKADYVKGTADVVYDPDIISVDDIKAKIEELDYTAEVAS